jgi:DNA-binding XRE family transcriptional regulator
MRRIRSDLIKEGVEVWTDEHLEPGTVSWKKSIEKEIEQADCLVALLSPEAKHSDWVEREMDYANMQGVRIIPVLIRGTEIDSVPFSLASAQWIDARSSDDYAVAVKKLVEAIRACDERPESELPGSVMLRLARYARGMTRRELAAGIGVSEQEIHLYENGQVRPTADVVRKLAEALELEYERLWLALLDNNGG